MRQDHGDAWAEARRMLGGLPGGGLNIGYAAADRHVAAGGGAAVALRCLGRDGGRREVSFTELAEASGRFAHVLRELGLGRGDTVALLLGRGVMLHVAALGTLKAGAVLCPLFAAFGPEPLATRLELGRVRALVTTPALYRRRVELLRGRLPELRHVLLAGEGAGLVAGAIDLDMQLATAAPSASFPTTADDPALLHFTSGTTGRPKGALHVHGAVVAHLATARSAFALTAGEVYWCTADPGWVTGTSYGIVAPLAAGAVSVVDEAEFDAARWYGILESERVAVWYTAPTAIRLLMRGGEEMARRHDLSALRLAGRVGEPLAADAVAWGERALGQPIRDTWWQTETGAIMVANTAAAPPRPGSMGRAVPGIEAAVVRRVGERLEFLPPGSVGELVLRHGWPSMFRGYLGDEARYRASFADGWYLSGDLVRRDADGWFRFVGRSDDVIKASGHLIGPFEVESVLHAHPAIAEAAVIGKPDPVAHETVKAFIVLRTERPASDALRRDILGFARKALGAAVAPKELEFIDRLPHTRSGKVMRRLLKARELGLPPGDTSTLEMQD